MAYVWTSDDIPDSNSDPCMDAAYPLSRKISIACRPRPGRGTSRRCPPSTSFLKYDLCDIESTQKCVDAALEELGGLDVGFAQRWMSQADRDLLPRRMHATAAAQGADSPAIDAALVALAVPMPGSWPDGFPGATDGRALLCLLPAPVPLEPPIVDDEKTPIVAPHESDMAADARAAEPLVPRAFDAALAAFPVHRALAKLQRLPKINRMPVTRTIMVVPVFAAIGGTVRPALASGLFDVRGVAVGIAGQLLLQIAYHVAALSQSIPAWHRPATEDASPFAGLARWKLLCDHEAGGGQGVKATEQMGLVRSSLGSVLVLHDPNDTACPCPAQTCAGALPARSATYQLLNLFVFIVARVLAYGFFFLFTAMIALADTTWTTPWMALFCVLQFVTVILTAFSIGLEGIYPDPSLLELDARLEARATKLVLADAVKAAFSDSTADYGASRSAGSHPAADREPVPAYISLFRMLAPKWRARALGRDVIFRTVVLAVFGADGVLLLISLLGAGCATAYLLCSLLTNFLNLVLVVGSYAAANVGIDRIVHLYRQAGTDLRLGFAAVRVPVPPKAATDLRAISRLELAAGDNLTKMFGITVTFGVVRGTVATLVTVGVGLFGILRGAGARATVQSLCPIG
ncbi:hypothetical protein DFJ74DRAFT_750101 [Hyaloraphidium curvatum]|nr:hypothetical protein DFJ74DRAFT_750101 [Hyaloraphidium curvatum]